MTDTKENIMGTLPIGKLLMKMSVPVILSMLVSTLYGVIDSIFVSRLGDNALTALRGISVRLRILKTTIDNSFLR